MDQQKIFSKYRTAYGKLVDCTYYISTYKIKENDLELELWK